MRKYLVILFCIISAFGIAQSFVVYSFKGNVMIVTKGNKTPIQKAQTLNSNSVLNIGKDAMVILLCEEEHKLCTIKTSGTGTISSFLSSKGNTSQSLSDSYFRYMADKIKSSDDVNQKNYMQSAGTSYRDVDSTIVNQLIPME